MKKYFAIMLLSVSTLAGWASAVAFPTSTGASGTFSIAQQTQVPGDTLKPGTFSIQVLDHLADRMVVRVDDAAGKQHAVFLAISSPGLAGASSSGALNWKSALNGLPALRGFAFPSGYTVEFVYPKAQAAGLAKANADRVIAIDPDSEGRPALQKMSSEDMQMITLWMLSLTSVGPQAKTPAILAQRYESHTASPVQTASTAPAPPVQDISGPVAPAPPTQVAESKKPNIQSVRPSSHPRTSITTLPHTASNLPLVILVGLLALFGVGLIRVRLALLSSGR